MDDDVLQYGQPPERYAISHRKMYAFGMHFRVRSAEGGLVTCDSCVVGTFTRKMPWGVAKWAADGANRRVCGLHR